MSAFPKPGDHDFAINTGFPDAHECVTIPS